MIGHQAKVVASGVSFVTLADLWPEPCRAVIVGVNPAPRSVEAGHYYQGKNGLVAIGRLRAAGLLPPAAAGFEDDEAVAAGVGFTDVVKRPTGRATDLSRVELEAGRLDLRAKLEAAKVPLVVCVFKPAVVALLGRADPPGLQSAAFERTTVFRMPGPYDPRERVESAMAELTHFLTSTAI